MIFVYKPDESEDHKESREFHLARLRKISVKNSEEIYGYDSKKVELWKLQYGKCCYCEQKIQWPYTDVEHYRPKAEAMRSPGCSKTHGYWWLAYSWENLFYSCASCNRSSKKSLFPLDFGSIALEAEESPPGQEQALLIYPGSMDASMHIDFDLQYIEKYPDTSWWKAVPLANSKIGEKTIEVVGLNEQDRIEVRMNYFRDTINPLVGKMKRAIQSDNREFKKKYLDDFYQLLFANQPFSLFCYCVFEKNFRHLYDDFLAVGFDFSRQMLGNSMDINYKKIH